MYTERHSRCSPNTNPVLAARALKRRIGRNIDQALAFDTAMFQWHYRFAILVLTLRYDSPWDQSATIETLQNHRNVFLNRGVFNTLLNGILGYLWKIEQGINGGGVHMHFVGYYDADRIRPGYGDVEIADDIGRYWVEQVTEGRGYCHNSNAYPENTHTYGKVTGVIYRGDVAKRFGQRDAEGQNDGKGLRAYHERYLCKSSQQVLLRNVHDQMFNTSAFPRPGEVRLPTGMVNERQVDYIEAFVYALRTSRTLNQSSVTISIPGLFGAWVHAGPGWLRLSGTAFAKASRVLVAFPRADVLDRSHDLYLSIEDMTARETAMLVDALLRAIYQGGDRYFVQAFVN